MATVFKLTKGESVGAINPETLEGHEERMYSRQLQGNDVETCSFCGEKDATGYWQGFQLVTCCQSCATEVLPKLMADALVHESSRPAEVTRHIHWGLDKAIKSFWYASSTAIALVAEKSHDRDGCPPTDRRGVHRNLPQVRPGNQPCDHLAEQPGRPPRVL